jgi:hypothetical protein
MVLTFLGPSGHCSSVFCGWRFALSFQYEGLCVRLVERESGGPVVVGVSARVLPLLLTCGSDGILEGGFSLLARAVP